MAPVPDPAPVQLVEGEVQRQATGLGAVTVAAMLRAADGDPQPADAVRPQDAVDFHQPDQRVALHPAEAKDEVAAGLLHQLHVLADLGRCARRSNAGVMQAQKAGVLVPAGDDRQILLADRAQADIRPAQ